MTLRPLADTSAADWFVDRPDRWDGLISRGPSGFEAYGRVLHRWMDSNHDERREGCLDDAQLANLVETLARHTLTPEDCFHALWDGYGDIEGGEAVGFLTAFSGSSVYGRIFRPAKKQVPPPPAFAPAVMYGPRLQLANRDYLLFGGPLAEAGRWGAVPYAIDIPRDINSPNLLWPADRSWFVATEIDLDWTGVAGSKALINDLLADPRLEVVRSGESL
ncbi:MAG: hypothetical protein ABIR57_07055 [Aeromicrobium sp.]